MEKPRYPKNAEGDFYVVEGCCIFCGIWEGTADHLIKWDHTVSDMPQCYIYRQPQSKADVDAVLDVMDMAELNCFRYAGEDADILRRMVNSDHGENCDSEAVHSIRPQTWRIVRFRPLNGKSATPQHFAMLLRLYFDQRNANRTNPDWRLRFNGHEEGEKLSFSYGFPGEAPHTVSLRNAAVEDHIEIVFSPALPAARAFPTIWVSDWLDTIAAERAWLTSDDLEAGRAGSADYR